MIADDLGSVPTPDVNQTSLNRHNGTTVWQQVTGEPAANQVVPGMEGTLFVLSLEDGRQINAISPGSTPLHSPIVSDTDIITVDSEGTMTVLSRESCELINTDVLGAGNFKLLDDEDDFVVAIIAENVALGLDLPDGTPRWQLVLTGAAMQVALTSEDDIVVGTDDGVITLTNADTG